MRRKYWYAAVAAVTVLFAVLQSGLGDLAPRPDFALAWQIVRASNGASIRFRQEAGVLQSTLDVVLEVSPGAPIDPTASFRTSGTPLVVRVLPSSARDSVRMVVEAATGGAPHRLFSWAAVDELDVVLPGYTSGRLTVTEWSVATADQGTDSSQKEFWRRILFGAAVSCLIVTVVGAVVSTLTARGAGHDTPFTAQTCIIALINTIGGVDGPRAREFLGLVLLQKVSPGDALDEVGLVEWRARYTFFYKTRAQFAGRLDGLIAGLIQYRLRLHTLPQHGGDILTQVPES